MKIVYQVLASKMKERKISKRMVARKLEICDKSLFNRLRGASPFTWDEVCLIRDTWFPEMALEDLFVKEKT